MARITKSARENTDYVQNGVAINPSTPSVGEKVKIVYDGLLSKSGANHVYARVGYGSRWENQQDIPMMRTGMGFETTVPVLKPDTLNLCFKDCANNWDNNSGMNYSFDVTQ
jgi:hypothetical protein